MQCKVIVEFTDLQDFNHYYRVGDKFPRPNFNPSKERIEELASDKNKRKMPLIKVISEAPSEGLKAEEETETLSEYTKTDINRMSKTTLVELATKLGLESPEDKNGSELKQELINYFGL